MSVYEEDEEAFLIWKNKIGLPESKIVRLGAVDNFWPSNAKIDGPNGPCGPCSEIYVGEMPGKGVEIWNLVFTQFDRQSDGSLKNLPQKNIDTGMGLERTASVLQGVESNFDIDIFMGFRKGLRALLRKDAPRAVADENAVMDHARAAVFSIADGALPSNEGRGYVVRKLIRLGCDHLTKAGAEPGQFKKLAPLVAEMMQNAYPEIGARQKEIAAVIENEENAYQEVLRTRIPMWQHRLKEILSDGGDAKKRSVAVSVEAFTYYDTYGVPLDLLQEAAELSGTSVDPEIFRKRMEEQKDRSRASSKIAGEIFVKSDLYALTEGIAQTQFLGYTDTKATARLLKVLRSSAGQQQSDVDGYEAVLIFDQSPFYAESGGQIGDTGSVSGNNFQAEVQDTHAHEKIILHKVRVKRGQPEVGKSYELSVDADRRADIMKNHTATHLLHSALRKTLGEHVKQSGSLVAADYLRFDFTHFRALDPETLNKIEALVNEEVKKNSKLEKQVLSKEQAIKEGAVAFFGEKYGEDVRVVSVGDFSKELCGGTHLDCTGPIGFFKITSESSIQAGVRRIQAVTGRWAEQYLQEQRQQLDKIYKTFHLDKHSPQEGLRKKTQAIMALKNRIRQSAATRITSHLDGCIQPSANIGGAKLVLETLDGADVDLMRGGFEHLKSKDVSFVLFLASGDSEKISFLVAASPDLVRKGFDAGKIVKSIAVVVEGNGGGRPDFAVGGGKRADKKNQALAFGEKAIRRELENISGGKKEVVG